MTRTLRDQRLMLIAVAPGLAALNVPEPWGTWWRLGAAVWMGLVLWSTQDIVEGDE